MSESARAALERWRCFEAEGPARREESARVLRKLAKTAPERATLAWLAIPALHDGDGSIDLDRAVSRPRQLTSREEARWTG